MPVASRPLSANRCHFDLTTFNYLSKLVRVVEIDGQPWMIFSDELGIWLQC
jgi:hypothetical protein